MSWTTDDYEDILSTVGYFFCPDLEGINKGDRLHLWAKVGGDMRLVDVVAASAPYTKGKKSVYIDVFGYDFRGSVNVKKLRKIKA